MKVFNESLILNEAFSPSMPKWLRERLIRNALSNNYIYKSNTYRANKKWDKLTKKGLDITFSDDTSRNDAENLLSKLLGMGVDLEHAAFKTDNGVPQTNRDPRNKPPYISFYLLEFGNGRRQVYVPGVNTNEKFYEDDSLFKYTPFKKIQPYIIDYCYIDTQEPGSMSTTKADRDAKFKTQTLTSLRKDFRQKEFGGMLNSPRYGNVAQSFQKTGWLGLNKDKSGYYIDNEKYKEALQKIKGTKVAKYIENYKKKIDGVKNTVASIIMDANYEDHSFIDDQLRSVSSSLKDCYYFMSQIIELVNNYEDLESNKEILSTIFNYFDRIDDRLDRINSAVSDYAYAEVDWD